MKFLNSKIYLITLSFLLAIGYFLSCTKNDQVLDVVQTNSSTDLIAIKTSTVPTMDGTIDAAWDNAAKLSFEPVVPDPGNGLFAGYIGDTYKTSLRSMYDDKFVYFLAEYADNTKSTNVTPWYFDAAAQLWKQEGSSKTYDVNGALTRVGFGEDKVAMLWNIDKSTPKFISQNCYGSCHVFTPYMDYSVTPSVYKSNSNSGNHYTNGANEKIDMWWGHLSKDLVFNQMDDNYQDWAGGPSITNLTGGNANGRHLDDIAVTGYSTTWPYRPSYSTVSTQGSSNNRQSLKLDGTGATVTVPMWIKPNASNYFYILASDTLSGTAVKIKGVSSTGVLRFGNNDSINPNVGIDYQRTGDAVTGSIGSKCFPSYIASPLINGRADITCAAVYTGSGWIVEYKRLLKTNDLLKQDVDFSSKEDFPFGFAIWDGSNNQHAIQPNLVLKFK
jgi:hypothetical protein